MLWPWNPGKGHSSSSEPTQIDLPPIISYSCSVSTTGLSRTVSEINGDFSQKSSIFHVLTPCILRPRWGGFSWNWVLPHGVKKTRLLALLGRTRSLTISSAVWIQSTNVTYGQTDGHGATTQSGLTHNVTRVKTTHEPQYSKSTVDSRYMWLVEIRC